MCRTPPIAAVQVALYPDNNDNSIKITSIQGSPSPSLRLQRTYSLSLSDDNRTLQLVLPPPPSLGLLRFERSLIESEAAALRFLQTQSGGGGLPIPELIKTSLELSNPLETPCLFLRPARGAPLAMSRIPVDPGERGRIDRQVGTLTRRLAGVVSPTGRFGGVAAVVPPDDSRTGGGGEVESWSAAFHLLLEGVLRDGEDMAVTMPYVGVRRTFRRLRYILDRVTIPRLVVVDGAEDGNVLVDDARTDGDDDDDTQLGGNDDTQGRLVVTGLQDWSNCLFGDPLIGTIFSDGPSDAFLEGFNGGPVVAGTVQVVAGMGGGGLRLSRDVICDPEAGGIRLLLYEMYHALVRIVRQFYRPRVDSSRRELEARKRLNEVLVKLGEVPDDPKRSAHERPSGEMSPAKRLKHEDDGEVDRTEANSSHT
ncbi:hypothetical protein QBC47DRAFT_44981 [Echria macrotheca]|uniref:Aminoglycoside phosphotransferase domain-containing protein n=1 Tax=Echria macrotheca TaxID=438768 RepID=A0AAJ0BCV0_9PEZI|nr:hypothetical protein QBC47DRAFT_44981 [Echria macrotheca]